MYTQAGINLESRTMKRALDEVAIEAEKLIWHPLQRGAGMRAIVDVTEHLAALFNQKNAMFRVAINVRKSTSVQVL